MANTLFEHGTDYHFRSTNVHFAQPVSPMRETEHDRTKPSKLELLQEDYRSRLLHERERKANALFEHKVKADLLKKQGSVREFFLNRRMLAATTGTSTTSVAGNTVSLPPIASNTRYKGKRRNNTKLANKRKEEAIAFLEDGNIREVGKLREQYRKSKAQSKEAGVSATNMVEGSSSPAFSSTCIAPREVDKDATNASVRRARGVKSREVYKRGREPSHETSEEANGEELHASSFTENEVSKSLVKIKELVHRRRKEELLSRSTTKLVSAESDFPSPARRNSQSRLDEMCKAEIELRETITREQKRLLALQEKQKRIITENMIRRSERESRKETDGKQLHSMDVKERASQEREKQKPTKRMNKSERESRNEIARIQFNPKERKQNTEYDRMEKVNSKTREKDDSQPKQIHTSQRTSETKHKEGNHSSFAGAMIDLKTCSNCGRDFMKDRITKHEKACKKASSRIKKPFDAKRKRAEGTGMEKYIIMGKDTTDDSPYKEKKRNWRRTHENFIQAIRSAKHQDPHAATPLSNPDYIECSHCQRKFKPTVAERHIPRCKDIKARPRPPRR